MTNVKNNNFWIFGYGSLMWRPGFAYIEKQKAELRGFHRAPCIYSFVHRGTKEKPGIVLGLAPKGKCIGLAFKIKYENKKQVLDYLRQREMTTNVYKEIQHPIYLQSGEKVNCYTYIVDTNHEQYVTDQNVKKLLPFIQQGRGKSGNNDEYMYETHALLQSLDINDEIIGEIVNRLMPKR